MRPLTDWTLDLPALVACGVLCVAYLAGVRRLHRRGRAWRTGRTVSFLSGVGVLAVATQSVVATYDTRLFSLHVAQHVMLGVLGPFLMALGAPVTLALQASRRPTQVNLVRALRSRPARALSHPVVAFAVFSLTLFILYFSPLYELSLDNGVVHAWVHVHFVLAGSLFFWVTVGLDPVARRVPYGARLLLVLLTVPFHAFLGVALLSAARPMAEHHYEAVDREAARAGEPPVAVSRLGDQQAGAALMWGIGDIIGIGAGVVVAQQWWRAEERAARRDDRRRPVPAAHAMMGAHGAGGPTDAGEVE